MMVGASDEVAAESSVDDEDMDEDDEVGASLDSDGARPASAGAAAAQTVDSATLLSDSTSGIVGATPLRWIVTGTA